MEAAVGASQDSQGFSTILCSIHEIYMRNLSSMIPKFDMNMQSRLEHNIHVNAQVINTKSHGSWDQCVLPKYVSMTLFHWKANNP